MLASTCFQLVCYQGRPFFVRVGDWLLSTGPGNGAKDASGMSQQPDLEVDAHSQSTRKTSIDTSFADRPARYSWIAAASRLHNRFIESTAAGEVREARPRQNAVPSRGGQAVNHIQC